MRHQNSSHQLIERIIKLSIIKRTLVQWEKLKSVTFYIYLLLKKEFNEKGTKRGVNNSKKTCNIKIKRTRKINLLHGPNYQSNFGPMGYSEFEFLRSNSWAPMTHLFMATSPHYGPIELFVLMTELCAFWFAILQYSKYIFLLKQYYE